MDYEDVPARLVAGEAVPRSEIIGYAVPYTPVQVTLCLESMAMMTVMEKVYEDDTLKYRITAFGMMLREDFLVRLDEECPDCP